MPADELEYRCRNCGRVMRAPRARVLQLVASKRTSCQFCGGSIEFPAESLTPAETTNLAGARDPSRVVRGSCGTCRRDFMLALGELVTALATGRRGWTCAVCRQPYEFPAEIREVFAELEVQGKL